MEITTEFIVLVPVVVGLVQAIKLTGYLPTQFAALVAIILGIVAVGLTDSFVAANILQGIVVGLSAAGLYSGTRSTLKI